MTSPTRGFSSSEKAPLGALALVGATFAVMGFRLFQLTAQNAVNVFYWDQWDFDDATLFEDHSLWEIFRWQHGPHRQGLGGLLSALVEPLFHWNSRTEAFLAAGLVVAAGLCGWYLKYRLFGSLSWKDVIIPMIMLTPARWDMIWMTVNLAHVILPILVIFYCLAWTCKNERTKFTLIVILTFLITYTGYGFFVGFLTPVLLFASYRAHTSRARTDKYYLVGCTVASVASLVSFLVGYRLDPASNCPSVFAPAVSQYLWFMDLMYAAPFSITGLGLISRFVGAIGLVLAAAAAWYGWKEVLAKEGKQLPVSYAIAALSAFVLLFCPPAALARTCDGLFTAHASRYTNYMQLSTLSLYFCSLMVHWPRLRIDPAAVLLVLVLPPAVMNRVDPDRMESFRKTKAAWRTCILAGRSMPECNKEAGSVYPFPQRTHLQDKLDYLQSTQQGLFADDPGVH
jgi:hypothetical protein